MPSEKTKQNRMSDWRQKSWQHNYQLLCFVQFTTFPSPSSSSPLSLPSFYKCHTCQKVQIQGIVWTENVFHLVSYVNRVIRNKKMEDYPAPKIGATHTEWATPHGVSSWKNGKKIQNGKATLLVQSHEGFYLLKNIRLLRICRPGYFVW